MDGIKEKTVRGMSGNVREAFRKATKKKSRLDQFRPGCVVRVVALFEVDEHPSRRRSPDGGDQAIAAWGVIRHRAVGESEINAKSGAHPTGRLTRFRKALLGSPLGPKFTAGQIDQSHGRPAIDPFQQRTRHSDFDIVRVGAYRQDIDLGRFTENLDPRCNPHDGSLPGLGWFVQTSPLGEIGSVPLRHGGSAFIMSAMTPNSAPSSETKPGFRMHLLLAATTIFLGVIFPLLIAEVGLRLFWEGYYEKDPEPRYQRDAILGWIPVPNFDGIHGSAEFKVHVTHDERGVRGGGVGTDRVAGASRVVFIGDSMTYGHAASDEEAFVGILHRRDNGIETVNLGVGGYNTGQQYLRLKHQGFDYSPDLVVMDVFWNDLYWENLESPGPRFEVRDGELVQIGFDLEDMDSELIFQREAAGRGLFDSTYVYRLVSDSIKLFRAQFRDNFSRKFKEGDEEKDRKAWEIFQALILETARLCREKETPLLVVLIPDQVEVETDKQVLGLPPRFEQLLPRLEAFLEEEGIDFHSPLPGLREHYDAHRRPLYFHMNRHMTPEGNQVLAEILEPVLKERLQAKTKSAAHAIDFRSRGEFERLRPLFIAHRGGVITPSAPEGSLSAIRLAAEDGYHMVELDIQSTADDHPVVFHDRTLEEDTGRSGSISDLPLEEVLQIPFRGLEETIPPLDAAIALCAELGLGVMLDFKTEGSETYYGRVLEALEKHGLVQSTITISSRPSVREFFQDKIWLRVLEVGEPLSTGQYAFDRASVFDATTIADLKSRGLWVVPALNTFHYPPETHMEDAERDARRLLEEGADGFQIDSVYQHFFGLRER